MENEIFEIKTISAKGLILWPASDQDFSNNYQSGLTVLRFVGKGITGKSSSQIIDNSKKIINSNLIEILKMLDQKNIDFDTAYNFNVLRSKKLLINAIKANALFFKECLNILSIVIKKRNSAKLISEFLAFQFSVMKKHNYFLNFLKRALLLIIKSRFSFIKGFKLIINGRLNGKPRAKNKFLIVGKVPLQSINSKIDYSTSVSYSQYGTFGFKVWICE